MAQSPSQPLPAPGSPAPGTPDAGTPAPGDGSRGPASEAAANAPRRPARPRRTTPADGAAPSRARTRMAPVTAIGVGDAPRTTPRAIQAAAPPAPGLVATSLPRASSPRPAAAPAPASSDRVQDRELSWLAFNQRVLELAEDADQPLLERARFLAIFASNLDEFFSVRVAGLKRRIATGTAVRAPSGLLPREVLAAVGARTQELVARHSACFRDSVLPGLAEAGIAILRWDALDDDERARLRTLFRERVYPVLTPLAVDPSHPFPFISGLSLNLAVIVRDPTTGAERFARVKVPQILPRFVAVGDQRFVPLEDVIAAQLGDLFPGMEVLQTHTFRVTRNQDMSLEDDEAENLLQALERELRRRKFGPPVRLEVEETIDPQVLDLIVQEIGVQPDDVIRVPTLLDLTGLHAIANLDRADLQYAAFVPGTHPALAEVERTGLSIFTALKRRDIVVHHPYDSFATSVQTFLEEAAADPDVLAIKQTLYRTSGDSPIVDALIDAARAGKQVLVVVEIKARFDEQANVMWARKLERAGCHVVYGLVGLKTHCKASLVVRQEPEGLRRYTHLGTGNYHPKTARLYEDFGLLTADPVVGADVADLFNHLSGWSLHRGYRRLLVAPHSVRNGIVTRIEREIEHHRAGRPAGIQIKVNSIVDEPIVDALYRASQAGVPVDMVVRGICALRAGVPGLSENIRLRSILGRFLEHSRLFAFANGGAEEVWIGSADLMHRNLDRRVEVLVQLTSPESLAEIRSVRDLVFSDRVKAWRQMPDGDWVRETVDADGNPLKDVQEELIRSKRRGAAKR